MNERGETLFGERERRASMQIDLVMITCRHCGANQPKLKAVMDAYTCVKCGDSICITCGCTDHAPCVSGHPLDIHPGTPCSWVAPGRCSACEAELQATVKEIWPDTVIG
ncbi:MAG: hypothetical protein ABIP75_03180 [Pyrinomonadaceae bacterium]